MKLIRNLGPAGFALCLFPLAMTAASAATLSWSTSGIGSDANATNNTITNVDGTGVNVTLTATLGTTDSEFFNGTPEVLSNIFSAGGLQTQIRRTDSSVATASATITLTFDTPVKNVSFIVGDVELQDSGAGTERFERITVLADGSGSGVSIVGGSAVSVSGNVATGTALVTGADKSAGYASVSIPGQITSFSFQLDNVPGGSATATGGSLVALSNVEFEVVPEPSCLLLAGLGMASFMKRQRRPE